MNLFFVILKNGQLVLWPGKKNTKKKITYPNNQVLSQSSEKTTHTKIIVIF